ncbi:MULTISPECIES: hypothetical protein [Cysteiniphilum]|uniref:Uncharacterized protein n=1 Tax=Cysteiniphilum litorale TaxID=2056700 RepID=A0A8J3E829_9GAMM|nr:MULTISPECIES: hypothetical protein [Cysteiniphilum]GGF90333.1 hypothetical protein GCM10010995_04560 [Cysteiniphilum litorale]
MVLKDKQDSSDMPKKWSRNWLECKLVKDDYYLMNFAKDEEIKKAYRFRRLLSLIILLLTISVAPFFLMTPLILIIIYFISLRFFWFILGLLIMAVCCFFTYASLTKGEYVVAFVFVLIISEVTVFILFLINQGACKRLDEIYFESIYLKLKQMGSKDNLTNNYIINAFLQGAFGFTAIWCLKLDEKTPYLFAFKTKYFRCVCLYPWLIYSKPEWFQKGGELCCFAFCRWIVIFPTIMFIVACALYVLSKF